MPDQREDLYAIREAARRRVEASGIFDMAQMPVTKYDPKAVAQGTAQGGDLTGQQLKKCRWCDNYHTAICPSVKAIEYYPDGTVKRVEFKESSVFVQQPAVPAGPHYPPIQIPNVLPADQHWKVVD